MSRTTGRRNHQHLLTAPMSEKQGEYVYASKSGKYGSYKNREAQTELIIQQSRFI